jgi:hypothetical protein
MVIADETEFKEKLMNRIIPWKTLRDAKACFQLPLPNGGTATKRTFVNKVFDNYKLLKTLQHDSQPSDGFDTGAVTSIEVACANRGSVMALLLAMVHVLLDSSPDDNTSTDLGARTGVRRHTLQLVVTPTHHADLDTIEHVLDINNEMVPSCNFQRRAPPLTPVGEPEAHLMTTATRYHSHQVETPNAPVDRTQVFRPANITVYNPPQALGHEPPAINSLLALTRGVPHRGIHTP